MFCLFFLKGCMMERRNVWLVMIVSAVLVSGVSVLLYAQQHMDDNNKGHMMDRDGMMRHNRMKLQSGMMGMPGMGMMGMGGMMRRQIVPTEDGGVIVSYGNVLIKYDKNLKQVAKTTFEISDEHMKGMMNMMKNHMKMMDDVCCPGHGDEKK
jgi:hypothetical protein